MAIVICDCGKVLDVPDEYAGASIRCRACNRSNIVPGSVFVSAADVPAKRKPWKDPVILIGVVIPSAVLIWFVSYLYLKTARKELSDQLVALRSGADAKVKSDPESAFADYGKILELTGGKEPADPAGRQAVIWAKKNRESLKPVVLARFESKQIQEREAERVAEEDKKRSEEAARLAKFKANISGRCWLERRTGNAEPIRGLEVSVVPRYASFVRILGDVGGAPNVAELLDSYRPGYRKTDPYRPVDLNYMMAGLKLRKPGMESKDPIVARSSYLNERAWPALVKSTRVGVCESDFEGFYDLRGVAGGDYLVCARYINEFTIVEWNVELKIDSSGELKLNIHNANSTIIMNTIE